ncbi:hypothetical protein [Elizabethkingia miricola]|uniref:hypothetical protein n=1 Tax=Elizabethkingia miricola TaxID=172045 RepID=UPI000B34E07A|nr:hypothetical protein [Elizabethkingia miricola]
MKRLEEIKNEYALELSEIYKRTFTNWNEMLDTDYERGTGVSKVYDIEQLMDEVAKRYAREVAQASLEKAAENVSLFNEFSEFEFKHWIDKESITNPKNITLL